MNVLLNTRRGVAALVMVSLGAAAFAPAAEARGSFHGGRSGGMHMGHPGTHVVIRPKHPGAHPSTAHHKPPPHAGSHAKPHPPAGHKPPPPRHDAHHRPPPPRHHDDHHDDHHDHHDHHHPRGPYWPGYWHDNDDDILWGAATALAIGSIIRSTPSGCSDVQVGNHMYKHCGNTWLQAAYSGHQLVYVAVSDPR